MSTQGGTLTAFQRKLLEHRKAKEQEQNSKPKPESHDADLIPEAPFEVSEADAEMDKAINNIDIIDAYTRWCGKMRPVIKGNQRESIMISCPVPTHPDKKPSAWINLDKQTWFCGGCQEGGDAHDIAAYHFGYPVPAYKSGAQFHELRREMAKDFGYTFTTLPGGVVITEAPEETKGDLASGSAGGSAGDDDASADSDGDDDASTDSDTADTGTVIELFNESDKDDNLIPSLDWRKFVPKDTFLDIYMRQTSLDDVAEEYHFFNALLALGFSLGKDVSLLDSYPVYGNLFICTLGRSGSGKSSARHALDKLLGSALPHVWSDENSKGVRKVSSPGSAEVLIHAFQKPVTDPTNPKHILYNAPVRGLIDFNELSALVGRSGRIGNVTIPTLLQFYDMDKTISTSSMSTGVKEASDPFGSVLTTTQPKVLKDLLTKGDLASGFMNRWIFVSGIEKERIAIGGLIADITPAIAPLKEIVAYASTFRGDELMTWSQEAAIRFTEFFHKTIQPDKKNDEYDILTRMDLLMKKLILLFTANRKLKEVPLQSVEDAIFCYDYIVRSYAIPAKNIGTTLSSEISDAILFHAKKQYDLNKQGVSLSAFARSLAKRKYPHEMILKTCDSLTKLGFLKVVKPPVGTKGRPTVRYKYVP